MEEGKKNEAYRYLYAAIQTADWINNDYRKMTDKYREDNAALKELFLCICDNVPIDILQIAELSQPVDEAFRRCRLKYLESDFLKKYTVATEHEMKNMSDTVKYIAEDIPTFDELFDENELKKTQDIKGNIKEESTPPFDIEQNDMDTEVKVSETRSKPMKDNWFKKKINAIMAKFLKKPQKKPSDIVLDMLAKNYSNEQIEYILSCIIDEGMSEKEIERFADPRIPVDVMRKLKEMQ